jgi:hypothetical protein
MTRTWATGISRKRDPRARAIGFDNNEFSSGYFRTLEAATSGVVIYICSWIAVDGVTTFGGGVCPALRPGLVDFGGLFVRTPIGGTAVTQDFGLALSLESLLYRHKQILAAFKGEPRSRSSMRDSINDSASLSILADER